MDSGEHGSKSSLALPSLILSLAGLLITGVISGTNLWVSSLQKEKELEIQRLKNDADRQTSRGELIFKNIRLLNSVDPKEQKFALAALVWTLGRDEADRLLASIQQFGPADVQPTARTARGEIQQADLAREAKVRSWTGKWKHTFTSTLGQFSGEMTLRVSDAGVVSGDYEVRNNTIKGQIYAAKLSEDGTILTGTWKNNASGGQNGRFYFEIVSDGKPPRFSGSYSMYDSTPQKGSSNIWSGEKIVNDSGS